MAGIKYPLDPEGGLPRHLERRAVLERRRHSRQEREPVLIRDVLPGNINDRQSSYIEAAVDGIAVASIYLPNGNPQPGPKFTCKLEWFDRLIDHAAGLLAQEAPAVLARDYNVVPTDFDIYATRSFKDSALLQPAARAAYAKLLAAGWTDALRTIPMIRCTPFGATQEPVAPGCRPQAGPCGRSAIEDRRRRPGRAW